jgi:hypothetical protein
VRRGAARWPCWDDGTIVLNPRLTPPPGHCRARSRAASARCATAGAPPPVRPQSAGRGVPPARVATTNAWSTGRVLRHQPRSHVSRWRVLRSGHDPRVAGALAGAKCRADQRGSTRGAQVCAVPPLQPRRRPAQSQSVSLAVPQPFAQPVRGRRTTARGLALLWRCQSCSTRGVREPGESPGLTRSGEGDGRSAPAMAATGNLPGRRSEPDDPESEDLLALAASAARSQTDPATGSRTTKASP